MTIEVQTPCLLSPDIQPTEVHNNESQTEGIREQANRGNAIEHEQGLEVRDSQNGDHGHQAGEVCGEGDGE